jgi:hypothetical protein
MAEFDREDIARKIQALLARSKSDNVYEAEACLIKANALMEKYKMTEGEARNVMKGFGEQINLPIWKAILYCAIAEVYGVVYWSPPKENQTCAGIYAGEEFFVNMAIIMTDYLENAIMAWGRDVPRGKQKREFRYGMASAINKRLRAMGSKASWSDTCAERRQNAIQWVNQEHGLTVRYKSTNHKITEGYLKGVAAGNAISLNRQAGSSGARCALE